MSPKFMNFYEKYMTFAGTIGNLMFYVQAYKIFTCKSASSVSLPAFTISAVALTSWLLYGIFLKNTPIIVANIVGLVGALIVLVAIMVY
ncbi:SemiSWEET family sugar transporter [Rickettsia endosymbiont of Halotydeus destructor]|uniref:SemiSWEET family sugar transporter n=1 Tax=Rickettsia endosymbiont of Halotydeus destructor TaxID=2996754 RepID=UPI003BB10651